MILHDVLIFDGHRHLKGGRGGGGGGSRGSSSYSSSSGRLESSIGITFDAYLPHLQVDGARARTDRAAMAATRPATRAMVTSSDEVDLDSAISQAKEEAASNAASSVESGRRFETYSGDYDLTYQDGGEVMKGQMSIQLTNNPQLNGYTITGVNVDEDGSSNVIDGFVHYTGEAWWVDEVESGQDKGLRVISAGKFDLENNNFEGTWKASSGRGGNYIKFDSTNATKTFESSADASPQTLQEMLNTDIPTVYGASDAEIPVVSAVQDVEAANGPIVSAVAVPPPQATAVASAPPLNATPVIPSVYVPKP
ncbi:hypothetical protein THAOC_11435 [Thalassiosira oceanica]|uniref:Uncharacterized protein n=1 Tax=Thalassiosira oceanica TaxID=159749 RepID=K0T2K1_THAOC|nr:hypothetical protein THAOC_11435 [Thalassiosira oceanica]|eukprot:EJK67516.1 hypothetical protein THAOC_11435 [Thalassiosira oceanica]